jgi:hypothetical protein
MPISQASGRKRPAQDLLEAELQAERRRCEAQQLIGQGHQRHDHDQHGRDVDQELDALARALGDGVHAGVRRIVEDDVGGGGRRFFRGRGVRHHQLGKHQPRRHADDGGDDQMSGGARQRRLQ